MAAYIALFISLVSLILMIVILIRFKKLFSADSIIEKTKAQMNRVIKDVNSNATRDIELINESSRRLRALLNEGDIKMEHFREASQLLRDTIAEAEKQTAGKIRKTSNATKDFIDPEASFSLVKGGPSRQGSLFDEPEVKTVLKDETIVTKDGAAFKEVPLIVTKVYDDEPNEEAIKESKTDKSYPPKAPVFRAPVNQNNGKDLKDKVEKLFRQGMQIDDIAMELSCPSSEVQFIIDML